MFQTKRATDFIALSACVVFSLVAPHAIAAAEPEEPADDQQSPLIAVLESDASPQDKALTCKKLAVYGNKEAVPALAALLLDEQLASWARIALEAIPDREAGDALRQAMSKLKGRQLVGVINSIGTRRDAQAVPDLVERLQDSDADVASAAAVALGRIGGHAAREALVKYLAQAPAAVSSAVAEGCLLCAERLLADRQAADAVRLYDLVRQANVAKQRVLEATRGAILARRSAGAPLLAEQLQSSDDDFFALGLRVARELDGREVTDALVAELGRAAPGRQVLLVLALADRGDSAALPTLLQMAKSGSDEVRIMAMRMLMRLGDASHVPVLLEAALDPNQQLARAAVEVLAELPGEQVSDDLAARLPKAEGKTRQTLIQLAGQRSIAAAVPALLKAADDPDAGVRAAALVALGQTVDLKGLPVLIARVANPADRPEDAASAERALQAACQRMPDREACGQKLVAAMSRAPVAVKCKFLEILTLMGGKTALNAVGAAARDADPQLQDTGSRLLGEWVGADAAPVLLDLVQTAPAEKYKIRALRGYIRLARQFDMPDRQRAEICRNALKLAKRVDEKKLVLEVLERHPSVDMLRLATEAAKDPSLKNDAAGISLLIAQKIGGSADVAKLLAQMGHDPVEVEIIKAEYGANTKFKDVTNILRKHVSDFPLIVLPSSNYNAALGGDPVPGVVKQLKVQYRINGKAGEASFPENATIMLPVPK
jgi:HEAT repeat protein